MCMLQSIWPGNRRGACGRFQPEWLKMTFGKNSLISIVMGRFKNFFYTRSETCYLSCFRSPRRHIYHGNFWAYFTAPLMRAYHCLIDAWKRCLPLGGWQPGLVLGATQRNNKAKKTFQYLARPNCGLSRPISIVPRELNIQKRALVILSTLLLFTSCKSVQFTSEGWLFTGL